MIIPWDEGNPCAHRGAALEWTAARWHREGHEVVVGSTGGPWCKADAVADGLGATSAEILVIADADCWSAGLPAAVEAVRRGVAWAMPHRRVWRLDRTATGRVLAGEEPHMRMPLTQPPYTGWPGGGIVVVRREVYAEAPLDPRFVGWSGEDESWAVALSTVAGRGWRGAAPLWHLWHPPQPRMSRRWGSPEARALAGRYRAAARNASAMRALINESTEEGAACPQ